MSVPAGIQCSRRLFADGEIDEAAVVKQYLVTACDGRYYRGRDYSRTAIIVVGFKVENQRTVQFRKRANQVVKEYTIKGLVMDNERLKVGGAILTYVYATAVEYDLPVQATNRLFMTVQNELRVAVQRFAAWQQVLAKPSGGIVAALEGAG